MHVCMHHEVGYIMSGECRNLKLAHRHGAHSVFNWRLVAAAVLVVHVNIISAEIFHTGGESLPARQYVRATRFAGV